MIQADFLMETTFIVLLFLFKCSKQSCNDFDEDNLLHLGTKTPYRLVANTNDTAVFYPGCSPTKIFGLVRHGTRTPGIAAVNEMKHILSDLKADIIDENNRLFYNNDMCQRGRDLIKNWNFHMDTEGKKYLTREGEEEMLKLAKRLQNRFPSLLQAKFQNDTFLFKYTGTQRAEESAKYFTIGLFGKEELHTVWFPSPQDPDPILRFYKLCTKWKKEVKKSPASSTERNKFIKSQEIHKALKNISQRLGLNYTLSFGTVRLMYVACSYETAWFPQKTSAWCIPFQKEEIEVLEYSDELKYYWRDGYGFEINYKQSCPLFKNIMDFFLDKQTNQRGIFYFTHSGTLLKAISRLGLYRDSFKLLSNTELEVRQKRQWKVSRIDAFGTNLVFVLFKCDGGEEKVLVTHQERQVHLEDCPSPPELCPLSTIQKLLTHDLSCDFNSICSL